ncbi:hypothetical protein FNF28_01601 [Cafeteria roenbergensis]|uniref:TOG domain-containing protein n=1 Tax=Cafeteria roenbergensis TaxID=33653 RepID=A0A5A8E283_CAFRO|nr:hypothetical protein FNF28_01601 [Cafeteria roenbergensis]
MLATAAEDATAAPATAAARALRTAMERRSSVAPAVVALAEPLLALARAAAARPAQPPLGGIEASAALLLAAAVDVDARSLVQAEADRAGAGVTPGAHAPKAGEAPADASPPTARAVAPGTPGGPPLAAAEAETFSAATGSGSGSSAGAAAAASSGAGSSSATDSSSSSSSSTATSTKAKSSKSGGKKKPKASAAELAMLGIGLDMPTKKKSSKKASKTSTPKASGSSSSSSSSAAAAGAGSSGASADAGAGAGASAAASVNLFAAVTDPASFLYARSVHMAAGRALGTVAPLVPALQAAAAAIAVGVTAHAARCRALPQLAGIMADLRGESAGNPELDGWAEEAYHVTAAAQEASAAQEAAAAATTGSGAGAARGSSKAAAASGRRPEKPQHTGANPRPILALCHPPSAADAVRGISATEAGASSAASTAAAAAGSRVKPTRPSAAASALAAMLVHAHPGVRRATAAACRAMVVGSGPMGAGDGSAAAASGTPSQRAAVLIHALWRMVRRWAADDHAATGVSGTAIGPRKGAFAGSDAAAVLAIGPGAHREDSSGWECGVGVSGGDSADDATLALLTPAAGRGASSRVFRARPRPQWVRAAIRGILADSSGAVAVADESDRWAPADAAAIFASLVVMAHSPYVSGSDPAAARRLLADAAAALLAACGASEAPLDAAGRRSAGLGAIAAAPCADPASDAAALAAPALFALRLADPASAAAAADSGAWAAVDVLAGRPDTAAALVRLLAGRSGLLSYVPSLRIGARSALATLVAGLPAPTAASSAAATWRRDGAVGRALAAAAIVPWARGVAARACRAPLTPADVAAWSNSADHAAALAAEADTLAAADAAGDDSARRPLPLWDEAWRRSWARREEAWRLVEAGVAVPRVQDGPAAAAAADAATAAGVVSLLEWDDADDADRLLCFGRTGSAAADWVGGAGTIADGTGMLRAAASLAQDGKEAASAPREASAAEAESAIRSGALVVRGPEHGGIPAGAFAEGARAALEGRRVLRTARRLDLRSFRAVAALEALRACFDAPHAAASHGPGRQSAAACAASLAPLVADELSLALSSPLANAPARATIEAAVRAACGASAETARLGASVAHDWAAAMAAVASMEVAAEAAARPVIVVGFGGGSALGAGAAAAASSAASLRSGMASGAGGSSGFGGGLGLAMGGGGASAKAAKAAKAAKDAAKDAAATATASRANGPLRVSGLPIRVRSAPGVNSANGRAITMSGARGRLLSKRAGLFRRLLGGLCHSLGLTVAQHGRTAPGAAAAGADSAIAAARRAADARLWLAAHDDDEDGLGAAGDAVCEEAGVEPSPALAAALMPFLGHPAVSARAAAARGLASVCEEAEDADLTAALLRAVLALHRRCGGDTGLLGNHSGVAQAAFPTEAAARAAAEADEDEAKAAKSGSGIGSAARWMARDGCMRALRELAVSGAFPVPFIVSTLAHVISRGLSDRVEAVRVSAMAAGEGLVETYGAANTAPMLATVEEALDAGPDGRLSAGTEERRNWQRGGCVVLLGALARHLAPTDRRVSGTVTTLLDTLRTPSEAVQRAVARCLPPLAKVLKSESGRIVSGLLESVIRGDSSAVRRGAAFGLAGCVKGFGLATLKAHDVMSVIEASAADKHHATARQGSMFAVERLCVSLGMLFEPYVIRILPALLKCYGDQEKDVRLAAAGASRAVMRKLSAHGVKLVMPSLLEGLGATQWRTKQASIRMLGATAFCAPKQLGACLPQVVPQLLNAHSDTHPKVRAAALTALNNVGGVVRNPEVSAISSELLAALTDPIGKTSAALDILASTSFVHAVDPPSLALLMPVLRRGLVATSAEVKQTACAIAGSMTSLVGDPAHLAPYLPELLPLLKTTVVDPIPDVRAVAARALGATVKGVGEDAVGGLLDWLKASTASTGSAVERSGGAQGLCEVAAAIGDDCVDETIEQMLARAKDPSPEARQGLFWFLAFLPPVLGDDFGPLLRRVFSVIVQGLADDMEVVRDIALRAGKVVVRMHGLSSTDVILPTLESGLMHTSWRVRQCAIKLVMDLVHRAAGDEGTSTDAHGNTLVGAHDDDDDAAARDDDEDEDDRWFEEKPEAAPAADDEEAAEAAGAAADAERRRRRKARRGGRGDEEDPAAAAAARVAEAPSKATMGAKSSRIVAALGRERRDAVLSAVYLLRSDGTAAVRQAAFPAWKSASLYMPGLLHDVLPSLVDRLVAGLASDDYDVRTLAVQGLGELTRRMGETIVAEVVPVLRAGLSPDRTVDHREGVCLGLAEMLGGIHRRQLDGQMAVVSPAVRDALCDESDRVRAAAGRTFAAFQRVVGQRAVDEVVQPLLRDLDSGDDARSHRAMLGLRGVLATRGEEILPILLPKLLRAPMSVFQVRTLAAVAEVTSDVIHVHAAAIIPPLVRCLACEEAPAAAGTKAANLLAKWAGPEGPPLGVVLGGAKTGAQLPTDEANGDVYLASSMEEVLERQSGGHAEAAARFLCAIPGEALGFAVEPILGFMCGSRSPYRRMAACTLIRMLLEQTDEDASEMASSIIRDTAYRLDDPHPEVIQAAAHTLAAVVTFCDRERLLDDLRFLRDSLKSALSEGRMRRGLLGGSSGSGAAAAASSGAAAAAASTAAVAAAPKGPLRLPGLCLPTAVLPLFDFYSWAVLKGPAESKQQAAEAIGELVDMAGDEVLTPHLKKMAGPLLRVLSDAYSVNVRVAMVETLAIIVERSPRDVKVLIVTLQSSLTRQLLATEAKLREVAAEHMSLLGRHLAKVDVICKEIQKRAAAATGAIRESCLRALAFLAGAAAHRVSPPIVSLAVEVLHESLEDDDALFRAHAARALGAFLVSMEPEEAGSLVDEVVAAAEASSDSAGDWRDARTRVRALTAFLALGSASQAVIDRASSAILALGKAAKHPQAEVRSDAAHCISYALISGSASAIVEAAAARTAGVGGGLGDDESFRSQAAAAATAFSGPAAVAAAAMLRRLGEDKDRDVRLEAALALRRLARRAPAVVRSHLAVLGPVVAALANDSAVQVKRAAEPAAVMVFRPQRDGTAVVASLGQAFVSTYGESIRKIGLRVSAGSSKDDTDGF